MTQERDLARTPEPPYVAVVFTSVLVASPDGGDDAYWEADAELGELVRSQPGFLGVESVFDPGRRCGITVSYWSSEEEAKAWKRVALHAAAQTAARDRWYSRYSVRVASVTRAYGYP